MPYISHSQVKMQQTIPAVKQCSQSASENKLAIIQFTNQIILPSTNSMLEQQAIEVHTILNTPTQLCNKYSIAKPHRISFNTIK